MHQSNNQSLNNITSLNTSNSLVNLLNSKKKFKPGEINNFDLNEMKSFFMKHYNDTNEYSDKLALFNLKQREKFSIKAFMQDKKSAHPVI